jgi:hypothetical protein
MTIDADDERVAFVLEGSTFIQMMIDDVGSNLTLQVSNKIKYLVHRPDAQRPKKPAENTKHHKPYERRLNG